MALYGPNALEGDKAVPFAIKLLNQFKDFLIIVLLVAALVSARAKPLLCPAL